MWWWSGMRGRWERQQEGGGKEREGEEKTSSFLSTNLKFEAFLDGEEEFSDQDRLAKGIIVYILCL